MRITTRKFPLANKVTFYWWRSDWCFVKGSGCTSVDRLVLMLWKEPHNHCVATWEQMRNWVYMHFKKPTDLLCQICSLCPPQTVSHRNQGGTFLEPLMNLSGLIPDAPIFASAVVTHACKWKLQVVFLFFLVKTTTVNNRGKHSHCQGWEFKEISMIDYWEN